ncbi:hypothetical protein R1sor_026308 [Riccia sorocarpa]|uniref:BHLH domain-containing protein n=1 Tax=Riccia sorocarpa TaxID=122646 RepID=A0ABD3GEB0_9MARC
MPSHYRSGLQQEMAMGHVNRHPFSVNSNPKTSMIHNNNSSTPFDAHRPYQQLLVDSSSTSAFQAVKDYSSCLLASSQLLQHQQQQQQNRHPHHHTVQNVEEVDVEAILHLGDLQDWTWPSTSTSPVVEAHEMKPSELQQSLQLPYHQAQQQQHHHQSLQQLSSTNIHHHHQSSDIIHHSDQKGCNTSSSAAAALLGTFPSLPLPPPPPQSHPSDALIPGIKNLDLHSWAATTIKNFDLPSWCSGVRPQAVSQSHAQQSLSNIATSKFMQAPFPPGGFTASAEPSVPVLSSDSNPLRVFGLLDVREGCTTAADHQRSNTDHLITAVATAYKPSNQVKTTSNSLLGVQTKWTGKRALSQRENHIWSERQRRKGMNHLFSTLRSLLPHPTSKTDKSTVVTEIIKYIKWLQSHREELEKKRTELLRRKSMDVMMVGTGAMVNSNSQNSIGTSSSLGPPALATVNNVPLGMDSFGLLRSFVLPNVALHISGNNGFITMSSPKRRGLLSRVLSIMRSYKLLVLNAYMNTSGSTVYHCLHVMTPPGHSSGFPNKNLQSSLQSLTLPDCPLL